MTGMNLTSLMNIKPSTLNTAAKTLETGISRGRSALNRAAAAIAESNGQPTSDKDYHQALAEARAAATQIEASAKALERTNTALGHFIDTIV